MSSPTETLQRIARLAPLAEILARVGIFAPVTARELDTAAAVGATLAADVVALRDLPAVSTATRDGWAVASELVADAGPYAPVVLGAPPAWVETGQPIPPGCDAVLPVDAVVVTKAGVEAHATATPGDGVIPPGGEIGKGVVLRVAGQRLRPSDATVLIASGIGRVSARAPRVKIFSVTVPTRSREDVLSPLLARAVEAQGCLAQVAQAATLESALLDRSSDAIATIGGTGTGKRDTAVKTLARVGAVELHGFGIAPGETAALGAVDGRPVLMLPGRIDAALAAFFIAGRALLAQLSGASETSPGEKVKLAKKVTSTVGIADLVLVRRTNDGIEPVARGMFPFQSIAKADGWILVPPESEGLPAGAFAEMRPLS